LIWDYITVYGDDYIVVWTIYVWGNGMPDEDNPFMVTPRKAHPEEKKEDFGTDELVSFMVTPEDKKTKTNEKPFSDATKPHWESSGTPIWDRKVDNVDEEDYEVVDHK
jgi:hypothetical protein